MSVCLQLFEFSDYLEAALQSRYRQVIPWFRLDAAAQAAWLAQHAQEVTAIATAGHIGCPAALMQALPALRIIATNGVGYDKVDVDAAARQGVWVTTTPNMLTDDVADLAVGLIIALLRRLPAADAYVRQGEWLKGEMPLARKVSGRRFGILGLGNIGTAIGRRLAAFGEIHYTSRNRKSVEHTFHASLDELAQAVDVLIVACAANADTRQLVNADILQKLGPQGYLVNIARGAVVDEVALIAALNAGTIAGAALDVFADEPRVPEALSQNPNVVLSPHIASATVETRRGMADLVLANLDAAATGTRPPTALRELA